MTGKFHGHNSLVPDASLIDTLLEAASRSELQTNSFLVAVIFLEGMDKLIDTARHIPKYYIQGVRRFLSYSTLGDRHWSHIEMLLQHRQYFGE